MNSFLAILLASTFSALGRLEYCCGPVLLASSISSQHDSDAGLRVAALPHPHILRALMREGVVVGDVEDESMIGRVQIPSAFCRVTAQVRPIFTRFIGERRRLGSAQPMTEMTSREAVDKAVAWR